MTITAVRGSEPFSCKRETKGNYRPVFPLNLVASNLRATAFIWTHFNLLHGQENKKKEPSVEVRN
jgi:hypothetical protein